METAKFNTVLEELLLCGSPASHPLLLPILILCRELSSENDEKQRTQRKELRKLENALSSRYQVTPAARYGTDTDLELDRISTQIANCQCEVLQKRPQAWQNVIGRAKDAATRFWHSLPEEKKDPALHGLHGTLLSRLEFLTVKLEGIENYAFVTLERLSIHREVEFFMQDVIDLLTLKAAQYYQPKGVETQPRDCHSTTSIGRYKRP
ncbi:hypothetical protein VP1G_00821 [Cytospora mali]|uniref:Uncharacterized protein n=1 Tax=Cytospora mali TaxID=578113 RepID=A0A194UNX9_CYTMA|nr:hypothetical protein VP1G_00821 [Valsa mali var. pyri (nom. inval.)]